MQLTPSIAPRAASLIALDTSDAEIPVELFPPEPNTLYLISSNPFDKEHFPITNARIWKEIEEIALAMAPEDSNRFAWLARAASSFGKPVLELEYLEQAVIRKPLDRFLRLHWAERLQASGDLESALEQVRHCQSLAPEDPQIEAFLKNLKALSLKSSGLKNMN